MTMVELTGEVTRKALLYLKEQGETIETFPTSIVDFVIEFAIAESHFPNHYSDSDIADILSRHKTVLAMMCMDIYSKAGSEGETSNHEGTISRTYESAWISKSLIDSLPNFVNTPGTLR